MIHDTPKPTKGWSWGPANILKPLPKFAVRLGAALTAASACGFGYSLLIDTHADWALWMGICGVVGAFLTTLFAKK